MRLSRKLALLTLALFLSPSTGWTDDRFDISYLWHQELAAVQAYRARVVGVLGPASAPRLKVVTRKKLFGLVYVRAGDIASTKRVARVHTQLLVARDLEPAAPTPIPTLADLDVPAGRLVPYGSTDGGGIAHEALEATIPLSTARGWLEERGVGPVTESSLVEVPLWRAEYEYEGGSLYKGLMYAIGNGGYLPLLLYCAVGLRTRGEVVTAGLFAATVAVIPALIFHFAFMAG